MTVGDTTLHRLALEAATDPEAALVLADALSDDNPQQAAALRQWFRRLRLAPGNLGPCRFVHGSSVVACENWGEQFLPGVGGWLVALGLPYCVVERTQAPMFWEHGRPVEGSITLDRPFEGASFLDYPPSGRCFRLTDAPPAIWVALCAEYETLLRGRPT